MRAISIYSFELCISTRSCSALLALRIRVSTSATGSVSISSLLPRALRHAGDNALVRKLAQADAAEPELLEHGARPPTAVAAGVVPHPELRRSGGFHSQRLLGHYLSLPAAVIGWPSDVRCARVLSSVVDSVSLSLSRALI